MNIQPVTINVRIDGDRVHFGDLPPGAIFRRDLGGIYLKLSNGWSYNSIILCPHPGSSCSPFSPITHSWNDIVFPTNSTLEIKEISND